VKKRAVRLVQSTFVGVLALAAGATAAAVAHWAIDAAGDVLLAHDTYDGLAHHSRAGFLGLAILLAALAFLRYLWQAYHRRAGSMRVPALPFVASVVMMSVLGTIAMEAIDAAAAGVAIDGIDDIFGGSLALGLSATVLTGIVSALFARAVLDLLIECEPAVAEFLVRILHHQIHGPASHVRVHVVLTLTLDGACRLARRSGKRAPPHLTPA